MRSLPICPEIYFRNSEALVGSWFYFQDSPRRSDRGDVLSGGRAGPKRPRKSPSKALGRLERNRRAPRIDDFTPTVWDRGCGGLVQSLSISPVRPLNGG